MSKIEIVFKQRREAGKKVNIAYITPEYPFAGITVPLCQMLAENNVHIIEIGVPFSDPLADGPVIQKSSYESLKQNTNLSMILSLVKDISKRNPDTAIVLMSYINPILSHGIDTFLSDAFSVGVDGVIIPDLPYEEIKPYTNKFKKNQVDLILLAAPTSPTQRLENIALSSRGFIYCVSVTGVTGVQKSNYIDDETIGFLNQIRSISNLPIAVGFGLSEAAQLERLKNHTDGFIIGSALIRALEEADNPEEAIINAKSFIQKVFPD